MHKFIHYLIATITILSLITLVGCSDTTKVVSTETSTEIITEDTENIQNDTGEPLNIEIPEEEKVPTYDFLDVHGESYTATLIETIPMHEYDYSRLNIESDLYTYEDEDGNITSTVGVDVSKYQGEVDWQAVKEYGIDFVIIRLGYRGYGKGTIFLDEYYEKNIEDALAAGLEVGVYFFSQAITEEEALEEAEFVLEHIANYDITMPVVFDTEIIEDEEARTYDIDSQVFTDACIVFCDRIEEAGYDSMIYFNLVWSAFTLDLEQLVDYDKWYADYYDQPQYPYAFQMWQYTESGSVPGITGNADINLYFNANE